VKLRVALNGPVDCVPLVAFAPLQPPDAVQLEALVELHERTDAAPLAMLVGLALNATVGASAGEKLSVTVTF
jgi:hypothetical protein